MKRLVLAAAGLAAAAALGSASPSAAQPDAKQTCFWTRDLRNHTVADPHTLYFNVGGRDVYRVTTSGNCLAAVSSSDPIVLRDRTSSGQVCNKLDLDLGVRGARCIVSDMTKLTPAEAAALPRRIKP
ncbi:DUF6491 family protein [Phenylobacterium sp.]|uniref:DUF6491 family protein n=1 Tax=Phenylobacterium sp. TaxID=1871053 RepID=UPI00120CC3C9|nr:DUF6491 family protein [Phenylobacterium sp.]THD58800.1 MAG: hypothetical protein E8A49_17550 [Phenylobacterium sp.]